MSGFRSFRTLAKLTCMEIPRQPALLLVTTTLLLFITSLPFLITHDLGEPGKLVRDSSLAVIFLGSLLLAVPASCSAVSSEIRQGTAGAILSKPVSRIQFLLAKFTGISWVMLAFSGMALTTLLVADRAASIPNAIGWQFLGPLYVAILLAYLTAGLLNFRRQLPFPSTTFWLMGLFLLLAFGWTLTIPAEHPVPPVRWDLLPAGLLLALAALMIQALALGCALRLALIPSLSICFGFFLIGLISDYLFSEPAQHHLFARVCYTLIPNWQHFWMADALTAGGSIPWSYVARAAVYAMAWTGGVLAITIGSFDRMEVRS